MARPSGRSGFRESAVWESDYASRQRLTEPAGGRRGRANNSDTRHSLTAIAVFYRFGVQFDFPSPHGAP
jgi:hypothetical protein